MLEMLAGWELEVRQDRNWLFVKIRDPEQDTADTPPLADRLWKLLREHLASRLVLELDEVEVLSRDVLRQLFLLRERLKKEGGTMRLCGLSPDNQQVLHSCGLDDIFPQYENREEAVLGRYRHWQPN
jgi:anti-anti-sigma factor